MRSKCISVKHICRELRESGELEIRDTPFNTADIVQELIEGVQQVLQPAMEASYEAEAADLMQQDNAATSVPNQQTVLMEQMLQRCKLCDSRFSKIVMVIKTHPIFRKICAYEKNTAGCMERALTAVLNAKIKTEASRCCHIC